MIKRYLFILAAAPALALPSPAADPALAWQFNGTRSLDQAANNSVLLESGQLSEWHAVATQLKSRLAEFLLPHVQLDSAVGATPRQYLRPLLDDLHRHESAGHVAGETVPFGNWVIAVQLDEAGVSRWTSALFNTGRQLKLGEPAKLTVGKASGWSLPSTGGYRSYSFVSNGGWLLVADSFAEGTQAARWTKALNDGGRPFPALQDNWLQLEFKLAALGWQQSLPVGGAISHVSLNAGWQGSDVRTTGTLRFAKPNRVNDAGWTIPKGLVKDPLVSFTAVRGMREHLSDWEIFRGLEPDAVPDQLFSWSRGNVAFINDVAAPVKDGPATFAHLERSVPAALNPKIAKVSLGQWLSATNTSRLLWRGLPLFVPYLEPRSDGGTDFIHGGLFPLEEKVQPEPAPEDLFAQFEKRTSLLYYDWEITAARLAAYGEMHTFMQLFLPVAKPAPGAQGGAWLNLMKAKLGNAITEVNRTGDQTATFTRRSPLGLTAFELWMLTRWIDSEEYPKFPYSWPRGISRSPMPGGEQPAGPGPVPAQRLER